MGIFVPPPAVPAVKIGNVVANSRHGQRGPFIEENLGVSGKAGSHSGTVDYPEVGSWWL